MACVTRAWGSRGPPAKTIGASRWEGVVCASGAVEEGGVDVVLCFTAVVGGGGSLLLSIFFLAISLF